MTSVETGVRGSPHTGPRSDVLVLGGGLAGLSVVSALIDQGLEETVHVFEPRSREDYSRDRTWCMWDIGENPLADLATHHWNEWLVRDETRVVRARSDKHPYLRLPADHVYDRLLTRAENTPSVQLHFAAKANRVESVASGVRVATEQGKVTGRIALDSRPRRGRSSGRWLLQSFVGWEVRTRDRVFDPTTVTLMDFRLRQPGVIEFFYVLPLAEDRALVESTVFAPSVAHAAYHERRIEAYVERVLKTGVCEIEYSERGVIPMGFDHVPGPAQHGVLPIGLRGGVVKPSTGYAFLRIQEDSRRVAAEVASGGTAPSGRGSTPRARLLDRIFLSFLRHQPELAPGAFLDLFDRVPADDLIGFLSEAGSLAADLRVIRALPPAPFLREAVRAAGVVRRRASGPSTASVAPDRDQPIVVPAR
ncbi:MAG: lycopene cyclase family protein [Longimicrobiales bacterium]